MKQIRIRNERRIKLFKVPCQSMPFWLSSRLLPLTVSTKLKNCYIHALQQRCSKYNFGTNMPKNQGGKSKVQSEKANSSAGVGKAEKAEDSSPISRRTDNSIQIRILAKPGAKQNSITGLTSDGVGVQIAAPPVEGEANTELVKYIAKTLGVRKTDVNLDQGSKSRTKVLLLDKNCGLSVEAVIDKLQAEVET